MSISQTPRPDSRARAPRGKASTAREHLHPATADALKQQRDLALALGEANRLEQALDLVLKAAMRVEGVECGGIYVVEQDTGRVTLVHHANLSRRFVRAVREFTMPAAVARQLRRGRMVCYTARPAHSNPLYEAEGLRAVIAIPIRLASGVVAALNLASRSADAFTPAAMSALKAITAQVGGTLRRITVTESLNESRRDFGAFFDHVEDLIFVLDGQGRILHANAAVERRLGWPLARLLGRSVTAMHPPGMRREAMRIVREQLRGRTTVCGVPLLTRSGARIPVETRVAKGRWRGQPALFGISRDISDRLAAAAALEQSEHRLHALFDATTDVALLMQPDGTLLLANDRMRAITHAEHAADLQGASVYRFLPRLLTAQRRSRVQEAVRTKKPVYFVDRYMEHWFDQRIFPVLNRRGQVAEVAVFQRDITKQRRLEQEIVRISEFEKHQLGQTLHDTLVQHLAGTAFLAEVLERRLTIAGAAEAADAHRITALIREGVLQARGVARGLSPLSAFSGGLEPALRQLAQDTRAVYGVTCLCTCNIRVPPASDQTANHIYYIAREAVSNAARHGHPTSIWVRLVLAGAQGLLRVTDNGRGLAQSEPSTGLGLNIMRYRAEALGGTVTVQKRRPQGTIVLCRFPLREPAPVHPAGIAGETRSPRIKR